MSRRPHLPHDIPITEVGPYGTSDERPLAVQNLLAADEFDMTHRSPLTGLLETEEAPASAHSAPDRSILEGYA